MQARGWPGKPEGSSESAPVLVSTAKLWLSTVDCSVSVSYHPTARRPRLSPPRLRRSRRRISSLFLVAIVPLHDQLVLGHPLRMFRRFDCLVFASSLSIPPYSPYISA